MSFAVVFSGQGMQHAAMLPWLVQDGLVERTCAQLGITDWRHQLENAAWAEQNANAQSLLTGLGLAAWQQLAPALPAPAAMAGYSVGELAAFSAAGVFPADTALDLARARAAAMDRCAQRTPGGLLAVSGLADQPLELLCRHTGLAIAIRNGPDSVVLGGPPPALTAAEQSATQQGARCTRLRVGLASHTPWMQAAADGFAQILVNQPLQRPQWMLFSNAADRVRDADQARRALAAQIAQTVRWDECMGNLHARGVRCVLEVGPGQALARIWNQRYTDVPARACDDFRSARTLIDWVCSHSND